MPYVKPSVATKQIGIDRRTLKFSNSWSLRTFGKKKQIIFKKLNS